VLAWQGWVSSATWFLCSPSPRQRAAAIEGPHDPIGADETQDSAVAQRFQGRLPRGQGEGIRAPDDGELARRRRDGALVDAGDPASGLVRHVDGVRLASFPGGFPTPAQVPAPLSQWAGLESLHKTGRVLARQNISVTHPATDVSELPASVVGSRRFS